MAEHRFIEPLDVLYLRGNRLFGDPGSHGEALMPPWPSLAAGAIRSRMLVDQGIDPELFAAGKAALSPALASCLGTVEQPGSFRVTFFSLARRAGKEVEPLLPAPADLVTRAESLDILLPTKLPDAIRTSFGLPLVPVLRAGGAGKPEDRMWIGRGALASYMAGLPVPRDQTMRARDIWKTDLRLGIALDGPRRTALEGHLYTADAIAFQAGHGFIVRIEGADGLVPQVAMLRFGGDGRAAAMSDCLLTLPEPPWDTVQRDRRFRLVLATPGIFPYGWWPAGAKPPDSKNGVWEAYGIRARLVSACVPRAQVVSGWDLARKRPKPAVRAAPVGSVYWFDEMEGSVDGLRRLVREGLWDPERMDASRRAEGFNVALVAAWPRRDQEV